MANLSAYINFSVALDNSLATPVIRVTDTGTYPNGILPTITGKIAITQADGATVTGDFTDITWNGSAFTVNTKTMRLGTDKNIQRGAYTIVYTVRATGYDDTVLTKTFSIDYIPSVLAISNFTDIFAPKIQLQDDTIYAKSSLSILSIVRSWSANINTVNGVLQTVTSSSNLFDIAYQSRYYDAGYLVNLSVTVNYNLLSDATISIIDKRLYTTSFDVYAPPILEDLLSCVTALVVPDCGCGSSSTSLAQATVLYQNYVNSGVKGNTIGLDLTIGKLRSIFNCNCKVKTAVHTNNPINAYSWQYGAPSTGFPPVINVQPQSISLNVGSSATFLVVASGSATLTYQWQSNTGNGYQNITNAISSSLTLTNLMLSQNGLYRVIITNAYGTATSIPLTLTVIQSLTAFYWYGSTNPYPALSGGTDALTYQVSQAITHNQPITLTLPSAGQTNMYGVLKVPIGEINKTAWYNTPVNNGQIPDAVWYVKLTIGQFDYYVTRTTYTYVATSPLIFS